MADGRDAWLRVALAAGLGFRRSIGGFQATSVSAHALRSILRRVGKCISRLREFVCPDCGEALRGTSPKAVRCSGCVKLWA